MSGADRLLHGDLLYRDFFEILPPGGFVLTAAWLNFAGVSLGSAHALAVLAIAGIAGFTYLACRSVSRNPVYPALAVLVWLLTTQGMWTQLNHHWLATLFAMIALWACLADADCPNAELSWSVVAGIAAGAAAMIVSTCGALAAVAAAAALSRGRGALPRLLTFGLACAALPAALLAYVVEQHTLAASFDDVIVFPGTRYALITAVPFGYFGQVQNFPLKFLFPVVAVLAIAVLLRYGRACFGDRQLHTCAAFALAGFIGCYPRPDMPHIGFAAPLALPLLVYALRQLTRGRLRNFRGAAAMLGVVLCVPAGISYAGLAYAALAAEPTQTERGRLDFFPGQRDTRLLLAWIAKAPPGDRFFFYPYMPLLPFLTNRPQVSKYDTFLPGYLRPAQYAEACRDVIEGAAWAVLHRESTKAAAFKSWFPGLRTDCRARRSFSSGSWTTIPISSRSLALLRCAGSRRAPASPSAPRSTVRL
ncbi:MAG: hypothetical protein ACM3JG_06370 [Thiohalocapsa sp.]